MNMTPVYIWMAIFLVAAALFWGTSIWAVIRGGRDVWEIISSEVVPKVKKKKPGA